MKKSERGSITIYVIVSMMFLMIIVSGLYVTSNNRARQQNRELERIQREYNSQNINDLYEEAIQN